MLRFNCRKALVAAALSLTFAGLARASVLLNEPFNYTLGQDLSANGYSVVITGGQLNASTGARVGANLTVAGQSSSANGATLVAAGNGDGISVTATRALVLGSVPDTAYYAAMINATGLVGDRATPSYLAVRFNFSGATSGFGTLALRAEHDQNDNRGSNGPDDFRAGFGTADSGAGLTTLGNDLAAGTAHLFVVRQTRAGDTYSFEAALDPTDTGEANVAWTPIGSFADADGFAFSSFDIRIKAPTDDNPGINAAADEIRIGTQYADVAALVPEPATLAAVAFAASLALPRRRSPR